MKRYLGLFVVSVLFFVAMACSISYHGLAVGEDDERPKDIFDEMHEVETVDTILGQMTQAPDEESTPEPGHQAAAPASAPAVAAAGTDVEQSASGPHEYSSVSSNFTCICQESGNLVVDFQFSEGQAEIGFGGGEPEVFEKIGENQYQNTRMGYYILREREGDPSSDVKVDREERTVITLTDTGYVMDNYHGEDTSPCCRFTMTKVN
jgi:hypothetical protein